jgi:hypothetical protein
LLDRQTWRFVATGWGGRWGWNGEGRLIRIRFSQLVLLGL